MPGRDKGDLEEAEAGLGVDGGAGDEVARGLGDAAGGGGGAMSTCGPGPGVGLLVDEEVVGGEERVLEGAAPGGGPSSGVAPTLPIDPSTATIAARTAVGVEGRRLGPRASAWTPDLIRPGR